MGHDISEVLVTEEQINEMCDRIAQQLNCDYKDSEPVIVGILTGAFIFTADLVRRLRIPVIVDFMQVASYVGTESTGKLIVKKELSTDITGRDILVVEDIIDTGRTMELVKSELLKRGAKSVKVCAAFDKPDRRVNDFVPDYCGIVIPDEFIVGYGLDYDGKYRNVKDVRIVR
ncbi:MAG: hypoxanthine phosphoribosyltransferase [Clostridiales bacterium]|nr:hypoxanthine phosphoribosyltransferase [Clostridiales bacterium]